MSEFTDGIFIIALTGWGQEKDRISKAAVGFDHLLVKPLEKKALEEILKKYPQSDATSSNTIELALSYSSATTETIMAGSGG
nr:hypothetical protein Hi04_10k_c5016_00011 [uncultured bacterium]